MDMRLSRWQTLATEHLPWLAHLSQKYTMPAALLARQLSPADLAMEIAVVLNETARISAQRLINAEDGEAEIEQLAKRSDVLARATRLYYERLQTEKQAQEDIEADAQLEAYMRVQNAQK
jgi:hypothetical protein